MNKILGALAALFTVAAFALGVLAVWTSDGRWGVTAMILGFAAFISFLGFAIASATRDES